MVVIITRCPPGIMMTIPRITGVIIIIRSTSVIIFIIVIVIFGIIILFSVVSVVPPVGHVGGRGGGRLGSVRARCAGQARLGPGKAVAR